MAHRLVVITGDKEVDAALASIVPTLQRKALRRAGDESSRLVETDAKINAPSDSGGGAIELSIKRRAIRRSRTRIGRRIIAGGPFEDREDVPFYAAFVELGTKPRYHDSGKYVGQIHAMEIDTPFLRPALYDNEGRIIRLFAEQVKTAVKQLRTSGKLKRRSRITRSTL